MRLPFTKMQGAGNDFVVLDALHAPVELSAAQARRLADRRFGVGADQILLVEPSRTAGIDFGYRIFNSSGDEVEHCGNGARCFVRYVHERGLTNKTTIKVETVNNVLELQLRDDGRVTVDMNRPVFELTRVPFEAGGLERRPLGDFELWPVEGAELAVLSMGNPHAVQRVDDVDKAPVATLGRRIQCDPALSRARSTSASCRSSLAATSGCASSSVGPARRWLAARGLRCGRGGHSPGLAGPQRDSPRPRRRPDDRVAF
jgi:diaminopimelate epimerase